METTNEKIVTYNETPSPEAVKAASMVSKFCYWMTNKSKQELFIDAFGKVMGEHLWSKVQYLREIDTIRGDLGIWLELDENNRQKLMHYILRTGYRK